MDAWMHAVMQLSVWRQPGIFLIYIVFPNIKKQKKIINDWREIYHSWDMPQGTILIPQSERQNYVYVYFNEEGTVTEMSVGGAGWEVTRRMFNAMGYYAEDTTKGNKVHGNWRIRPIDWEEDYVWERTRPKVLLLAPEGKLVFELATLDCSQSHLWHPAAAETIKRVEQIHALYDAIQREKIELPINQKGALGALVKKHIGPHARENAHAYYYGRGSNPWENHLQWDTDLSEEVEGTRVNVPHKVLTLLTKESDVRLVDYYKLLHQGEIVDVT